jgi:hypothetical protein
VDPRLAIAMGVLTIAVSLITPDPNVRQAGFALLSIGILVVTGYVGYLIVKYSSATKENLHKMFSEDDV